MKGHSAVKIINRSIIYENPLPQLKSRQSFFPFLAELADGRIMAMYCIGEAFESVDLSTYISFSSDKGASWTEPRKLLRGDAFGLPVSDCAKPTVLPDGRILALGYAYIRTDPTLPMGNPENGGLLDDIVYYTVSEDMGESWSAPTEIICSWGRHVEASAPVTVLKDGTLITPITGFPDWEGKPHGKTEGHALISTDGGGSWSDSSVCMSFDNDEVTAYEQRMCVLESGTVVNIGWNESLRSGERLDNHYTISTDGGRSWSAPRSTGIRGQASSVCAIGGERLLAIHAVRRDTDRPGIYAYIVDLSEGEWNITKEMLVWEPATPVIKDKNMAEIFSYLKFGQPGAILLRDGDILMSHWFASEGQYKTVCTRIRL